MYARCFHRVRIVLRVAILAVPFTLASRTPVSAAPILLNFDTLATGYNSPVPNGYGGLQWNNMYVANGGSLGDGYANGVVSGQKIALNGNGTAATISYSGLFTLKSAYLTGAFNDQLVVEAKGSRAGNVIYDKSFVTSATHPTLLNFDFLGIDSVLFTTSGGYPYYSRGTQFAMDNLSVDFVVPEPTAFGILPIVLTALRRRRRLRN